MRIFLLGYSYERGLGGDAGGFRKLWELAAALGRRGHDVLVLHPALPGHAPARAVPSYACPVIHLPLLRPLTAYASMAAAVVSLGRRRRPDIVYFRTGLNVSPPLLGALLGARVVLEVNADALADQRSEGVRWPRRLLTRFTEMLNVRYADRVVALTPGLKDMILARYGAPPAKVAVVASGTDPAHFRPMETGEARRRLGLDPLRTVVGFVGLCYRHQGVPTLLAALARLRAAVPGVTGLIVGDGVMRTAWEARARQLGVDDLVRFTGQVPYAEVPLYFNAMDVVVAPFTADRAETSPFKVLDALACARPVVASDIASIRSLAAETAAVVLVPPDDAERLAKTVAALLDDPQRSRALGEEGRTLVQQRYGWDRIADDVVRSLGAS